MILPIHRRVGREHERRLRSAIAQASGTIFTFAGRRTDGRVRQRDATRCNARSASRPMRSDEWQDGLSRSAFASAITCGRNPCRQPPSRRRRDQPCRPLGSGFAPPGGIALPGALHDQIRHAIPVPATPMGQPALRGISQTCRRSYAISAEACLAWAGHGPARADRQSARRSSPVRDPRASLAVVPFRSANAPARGLCGSPPRTMSSAAWRPGDLAGGQPRPRRVSASARRSTCSALRQTSDARYILHGAVEAERTMLRLTVELNEAETGRVLWSDRFDHLFRRAGGAAGGCRAPHRPRHPAVAAAART